jgi:hypothetical protein
MDAEVKYVAMGDVVVVSGVLNGEKKVETDENAGIEKKQGAAGSVFQHFPMPFLVDYLTGVTEEL